MYFYLIPIIFKLKKFNYKRNNDNVNLYKFCSPNINKFYIKKKININYFQNYEKFSNNQKIFKL